MRYQRTILFAIALYATASLTTAVSADEPARSLAEQAAVDQLRQLGVLIHYNDRLPERPVILVDFTNHTSFREDWLKHLTAFPHLTGLGLSGTSITDEDLRPVKKLRALGTLTLAEAGVTDEGLAGPNLQTAELAHQVADIIRQARGGKQ